MPRMARSLSTTQARADERLLDPFAGTCGILIEACLIGIKSVALKFKHRMVKGALCNLHIPGLQPYIGDAKRLPLKDASMDGAVLDTPYGRSAKILAVSKELLLEESLKSSSGLSSQADAWYVVG